MTKLLDSGYNLLSLASSLPGAGTFGAAPSFAKRGPVPDDAAAAGGAVLGGE